MSAGDQAGADEVVLEIGASAIRRWVALLALLGLALLFFRFAIGDVPDLWRLLFVGLGAAILWCGNRLRVATLGGLVLTRSGLETAEGEMLARLDNIDKVERGAFAFKPSNGFLLRLKEADGNGWAPGLWWKFGRRIGVGGTLSNGQSRAMAETIIALQAERDSGT